MKSIPTGFPFELVNKERKKDKCDECSKKMASIPKRFQFELVNEVKEKK